MLRYNDKTGKYAIDSFASLKVTVIDEQDKYVEYGETKNMELINPCIDK